MQLALSTGQENGDYRRPSDGGIGPIGSIEQHRPNRLIGTDHFRAEVVGKGVGAVIGILPVLIASG